MYADALSSYPTFHQLDQLKFPQAISLTLGSHFCLPRSQRGSSRSAFNVLIEVKSNNMDLKWKDIVEGLLVNGRCNLARSVCTQIGKIDRFFAFIIIHPGTVTLYVCSYTCACLW